MSGYFCDANTISTASESLNLFLNNFSGMCAYMKQETFIVFISLITAVHNFLKNKKLNTYREDVTIKKNNYFIHVCFSYLQERTSV